VGLILCATTSSTFSWVSLPAILLTALLTALPGFSATKSLASANVCLAFFLARFSSFFCSHCSLNVNGIGTGFYFSNFCHNISMLLEQDIGFEPMTFSLATKHSTTELILRITTYKVRNNESIQANSRYAICKQQHSINSPQQLNHGATSSDYNSQV
jgi:hypothetical protein